MRLHGTYKQIGMAWITVLSFVALTACNQNNKTSSISSSSGSTTAAAAAPSSNANGEIDACTLVTKAEAEQAMGEKLKDADSGPASMQGGTICRYESPDSLSARNVTIRVESPNFNWSKYKEERRVEGEKMQPKRGRVRPVAGLGKEAYFARHVLHVLTDHGILTVIIFKDVADAAAGEEVETKAEALENPWLRKRWQGCEGFQGKFIFRATKSSNKTLKLLRTGAEPGIQSGDVNYTKRRQAADLRQISGRCATPCSKTGARRQQDQP